MCDYSLAVVPNRLAVEGEDETFAKLQLEYVHGCPMNTSEILRLMPMELTSVAKYAVAVCGQKRASA